MKTSFEELPTSWKRNKLGQLKGELARGKLLEQFTQEERDLLHMETSEENVRYWKEENERALTDERCLKCQSIARSIIIALRSREAPIDDTKDTVLCEIMTEADRLPAMH